MANKPQPPRPERATDQTRDENESTLPSTSAWRPDQNDPPTLRGKLVKISIGETMYGRYPIVTIDTGIERLNWHAMSTLAKSELVSAQPELGDELEIGYHGKVTQQKDTGHHPYHAWTVTNHTRPLNVATILDEFGGAPRQAKIEQTSTGFNAQQTSTGFIAQTSNELDDEPPF